MVRVEPLTAEEHCDDLFAAFSADPNHTRWTYRFQSGFDTRDELFAYLVSIESHPSAHYGVYIDVASGKASGLGALMSISPANGSLEIGAIMLAPCMSGTPAGTEALVLQLRWAFEAGYRRVEWTCDPLNLASMRAAQRLGFSYEATFRQRYVSKGRNRDQAIFSIVDGDWPAIDVQHRAWLDGSNFDEAAKQRRALSAMTLPILCATAPVANPHEHQNEHGQPLGLPLPSGWTPPPKPVRRTLQGACVACAPLTVDHASSLYLELCRAGDEHWAWLAYGPFASESEFTRWVGACTLATDTLFHTIIVEGQPVGIASFLRIFDAHASIEIGHLSFGPTLKQSRAATEALYLMIAWAFGSGYRRVEWKCNAANAPSWRAATRLGFVPEGILRQHAVVKGHNRDSAWLSIVDGEWPRVDRALQLWLSPDNFDEMGRQRQRLEEVRAALPA